MKKIIPLCLALVLALATLTACGGAKTEPQKTDPEQNTQANASTVPSDKVANLKSFTTTDLYGTEVTQDVFKDADVTMVNIWATWCGFCVEEMPELQKVYEQLPEGANMISICSDGESEGDLAKQILEKNEVKFKALLPSADMEDSLLSGVSSFPTTVFVDKEGNLVGNPVVGVPGRGEAAVSGYLTAINAALQDVKQ